MSQHVPDEGTEPAPPVAREWRAWAALAAVAAGCALVMSRFVFLPLRLPGDEWLDAVIGGVCVALFITGRRSWRTTRSAGVRLRLRLGPLLVAIAPSVLVILAMWRAAPSDHLRTRHLPAVEIDLPDWWLREKRLDPQAGSYVLAEPAQSGVIALRWSRAPEMTPAEIVGFVAAQLPESFTVERRAPTRVSERPAETVFGRTRPGGPQVLITVWHCPDEGQQLRLTTRLDRGDSDARALHDRILATIRCRRAAGDEAPLLARLDPPADLTRVESPIALAFEGEDEYLEVSPGMHGMDPYFAAVGDPRARARLLAQVYSLSGLELRQMQEGRAEGRVLRQIWSGAATREGGKRIWVTSLALYCTNADRSFVGIHLGGEGLDHLRGLALLMRVECPEAER